MAALIPPPPNKNTDFNSVIWKTWFHTMWRRVKGLEPGETDGGDSNAVHQAVANEVNGMTAKASPVDADIILGEDSANSWSKIKIALSSLKSYIQTAFDSVYLKLDASNDPITAPLEIEGAITATGVIENVNTTAKTANYTITATDDNVICDTSGGAFTITLPASPENGRVYTIILETAGNILTLDGNGKNIVGAATLLITSADDAAVVVYNGTQWSLK